MDDTKVTSPEETKRLMDETLSKGVKPHATEIARIWDMGEIAVVVYEPLPPIQKMARAIGWDKFSGPVFYLSHDHYPKLASADAATARWLKRTDVGRVLLLTQGANFLVNCDTNGDGGWSFEPGSTDVELKATRS